MGIGLEFHTSQLSLCRGSIDFIEYGYHALEGFPPWLRQLQQTTSAVVNLHPLDVNLADSVPPDGAWLERLKLDADAWSSKALTTDAFYWYFRDRSLVWPRPAHFQHCATACGYNASVIAQYVGLPFRIENPPTEWMPDYPDVWSFLDRASNAEMLEICLDLSHLVQFEWNAHCRRTVLPKYFPWERVTEVHLAGYVKVEYSGRTFLLDEHAADITESQLSLLAELAQLRSPQCPPLDVCLEMEPREPGTVDAMCETIRRIVD